MPGIVDDFIETVAMLLSETVDDSSVIDVRRVPGIDDESNLNIEWRVLGGVLLLVVSSVVLGTRVCVVGVLFMVPPFVSFDSVDVHLRRLWLCLFTPRSSFGCCVLCEFLEAEVVAPVETVVSCVGASTVSDGLP